MTLSLAPLDARDTARLIPSQYSDGGDSVLARIADDQSHLDLIFELDHATNDRLMAQNDLLPGIGRDELVFAVPFHRIINAAFCHANPTGSRFNGPDRGCWYAGDCVETSLAEVVFHKSLALTEINRFEDEASYDCYLADLSGSYHHLTDSDLPYLDPDDYRAAQTLAETLLGQGATGVRYPSVRAQSGDCYACFRPAMIANVRKAQTLKLVWSGQPEPSVWVTDPQP